MVALGPKISQKHREHSFTDVKGETFRSFNGNNKLGSGMDKNRIRYEKKNLLIFQFSEKWGQSEDTYCSRGITRVPSGEQSHCQSASEGWCNSPCQTETLAMHRVGFDLFQDISIKTVFINSLGFLFKNLFKTWRPANTNIFIDFLGFSEAPTGTYDYNVIHVFIDSIQGVRHVKIIGFLTYGLT